MPAVKSKFKTRNDAIEEEAKKLQEDEETKLVYQQFIDSFNDSGSSIQQTWVKAGSYKPGSSGNTLSGESTLYKPTVTTPVKMAVEASKETKSVRVSAVLPDVRDKPLITKSKKRSNLEEFSEELKRLQRERELRASKPPTIVDMKNIDEMCKNSFDPEVQISLSQPLQPVPENFNEMCDAENDRTTTNLFLGNLSPELSEQHLCVLFGRYGPLASVKVMWPRKDEDRARGRNCGFVAFMNRGDGERALERLRGAEICDFEMKLGWGKTVLIPPNPVYVPPLLAERIRPPPPSGLPFNAQPRDWLAKLEKGIQFERKPFQLTGMSDAEVAKLLQDCVVKVTVPTDRNVLHLVNRMVEFVVREGIEFEAYIMNKEMNNPMFKFLFDFQSPDHIYYRWKLFSILHGDTAKTWKTAEFQLYEKGPFWRPPPMNPYTAGMPLDLIEDIDLDKNISIDNLTASTEKENTADEHDRSELSTTVLENPYKVSQTSYLPPKPVNLSENDVYELTNMLAQLDAGKFSIGETMVWCMDRADHAEQILETIVCTMRRIGLDSVDLNTLLGKPSDDKEKKLPTNLTKHDINHAISLLFLLSDLLHNSSSKVRNASYYRKFMEVILPDVMIIYNNLYQSITSKIKSELFKSKVLSVFGAWGDWYAYPYELLLRLQNSFLGIQKSGGKKDGPGDQNLASTSAISSNHQSNLYPNNLDKSLISVAESSLSLVDYDGDPLDVDGVPLEEGKTTAEDEKGDKDDMDRRIDMFDMFDDDSNSNRDKNLFVESKWETVDPTEEDNDLIQSRWSRMENDDENGDDKSTTENKTEDTDGFPLAAEYEDTKITIDRIKENLKSGGVGLVSYGGDSSSNANSDPEEDGIPISPTPSHSSSKKKKKHKSHNKKDNSSSKSRSHQQNDNPEDPSRRRRARSITPSSKSHSESPSLKRSANTSSSSKHQSSSSKKHKLSTNDKSSNHSRSKSKNDSKSVKHKDSKRKDEKRSKRSRSRKKSRSRSKSNDAKRSRRR